MEATTPPAEVPGYRLQQFLGAGAFGQVWTGQDLNTGRSVAVKFFLHRSGVNWSLLSREVKNLVQLSADRHVVQVLEVGWDSDPPYYIMELVTGGSLDEFLQSRERLPVSEAVGLFREICVGLNHCHSKGVLHCDLKPANILLGEENEPRLADFGQSRMSHDQTPSLGTLFYMAPEQADLESTPDSSWDVYAVGAIMFRMLTGHPPYRDDTVMEHLDTAGSLPKRLERYREAIATNPKPTEHLKVPGVDRALGRIISRCLEVNPDERYANVQALLADLKRREDSRARRPLILMGILGPIFLLAASGLFGARTIDQATESTRAALRTEAFGSNKLAAKFAARTFEYEVSRYFQLAREESQQEDFVQQIQRTLKDESLTKLREEIASAGTSLAVESERRETREHLLDNPQKKLLDEVLSKRLKRYFGAAPGSRQPKLATMFVTDRYGTIISIAYGAPVPRDRNSAGRNYAYRTYFHSGRDDLDRSTPIDSIQPLNKTHLSAAFSSSATDLWKVAISTPVYLTEDRTVPDAVFVATINLGDFQLQADPGANQIAVLVEAREGPRHGTVLQHPLMGIRHEKGIAEKGDKFHVPEKLMDQLLGGGDVDYQDPMAEASGGKNYGGNWIAAIQPVILPQGSNDAFDPNAKAERADLLVLVQYRLAKVFKPVDQMRTSLLWEGAAGVISVLLVTMTLWYFVRRVSDRQPVVNLNQKTKERTAMTETMASE